MTLQRTSTDPLIPHHLEGGHGHAAAQTACGFDNKHQNITNNIIFEKAYYQQFFC